MGLLLIIPILAFDLWLALTTGKRAVKEIMTARKWAKLAFIIIAGLVLAVWFTFYASYNMGEKMRIISFPIPAGSVRQEGEKWVNYSVPQPFLFLSLTANFLTGLILPLIPFKIAEFLKTVKQELR